MYTVDKLDKKRNSVADEHVKHILFKNETDRIREIYKT